MAGPLHPARRAPSWDPAAPRRSRAQPSRRLLAAARCEAGRPRSYRACHSPPILAQRASGPSGPRERRREGFGGTKSPDKYWSGRRGSNPRPTAWKAVTLPLSYSRLASLVRGRAPPRSPLRVARPFSVPSLIRSAPCRHVRIAAGRPAEARGAGLRSERRLVARGGFEPPKPLGRQIYSLLRLTASLPRRSDSLKPVPWPTRPRDSLVVLCLAGACTDPRPAWNNCGSLRRARVGRARNLELAKGFEPPTG